MTLYELKERVQDLVEQGFGDKEVVIPASTGLSFSKENLNPTQFVEVKKITLGFNWDNYQIRIEPEQSIYQVERW